MVKKQSQDTMGLARNIVSMNTINDVIYHLSQQTEALLKSLTLQKPGKEMRGVANMICKIADLQYDAVSHFKTLTEELQKTQEMVSKEPKADPKH